MIYEVTAHADEKTILASTLKANSLQDAEIKLANTLGLFGHAGKVEISITNLDQHEGIMKTVCI